MFFVFLLFCLLLFSRSNEVLRLRNEHSFIPLSLGVKYDIWCIDFFRIDHHNTLCLPRMFRILISNVLGNLCSRPRNISTIVYAKFVGRTACVEDSKTVNFPWHVFPWNCEVFHPLVDNEKKKNFIQFHLGKSFHRIVYKSDWNQA